MNKETVRIGLRKLAKLTEPVNGALLFLESLDQLADEVRQLNEEKTGLLESIESVQKELKDRQLKLTQYNAGYETTLNEYKDKLDTVKEHYEDQVSKMKQDIINKTSEYEAAVKLHNSKLRMLDDDYHMNQVKYGDAVEQVNVRLSELQQQVSEWEFKLTEAKEKYDAFKKGL